MCLLIPPCRSVYTVNESIQVTLDRYLLFLSVLCNTWHAIISSSEKEIWLIILTRTKSGCFIYGVCFINGLCFTYGVVEEVFQQRS